MRCVLYACVILCLLLLLLRVLWPLERLSDGRRKEKLRNKRRTANAAQAGKEGRKGKEKGGQGRRSVAEAQGWFGTREAARRCPLRAATPTHPRHFRPATSCMRRQQLGEDDERKALT
jgi:hypothetical protein